MQKLATTEDWRRAQAESGERPVVIFKASATCSLSGFANRELKEIGGEYQNLIYKLIVQDARDVSNLIAEELEITHESPQVIVIRNGNAVFDADHEDIDANSVQEVLDENR